MPNRRRTWPYEGQATSPPAVTVSPDGTLRSNRDLVGPERFGTSLVAGSPVGPRGNLGDEFRASDFGMDRVSPRGVDPMGWPIKRTQEPSELISRGRRNRRR